MTDQILTGTNPTADARLIADVMQAPAAKLEPQTHGERMHARGIEAGVIAVLKSLSQHRREVRDSGDHTRADALSVAIDFLLTNRDVIEETTKQEYLEAFSKNR